jgi:ABC-2 type transport system ATP-binding protein
MELWPVIRALAPTVLVTAPAADRLIGRCDRVFTLARGRLTEPAEQPTGQSAGPGPVRRAAPLSGTPARARRAQPRSRPQRIGAGV